MNDTTKPINNQDTDPVLIYSGPVRSESDRRLAQELHEAETKAIDALGRYKFTMFGYWAGIWVHLNKIEGKKRPSPFRQYVIQAKADSDAAKRNAGTQHGHTTPRVGCVECGLGFTPYEGDIGTPPEFDSSAGASGTIPANW